MRLRVCGAGGNDPCGGWLMARPVSQKSRESPEKVRESRAWSVREELVTAAAGVARVAVGGVTEVAHVFPRFLPVSLRIETLSQLRPLAPHGRLAQANHIGKKLPRLL